MLVAVAVTLLSRTLGCSNVSVGLKPKQRNLVLAALVWEFSQLVLDTRTRRPFFPSISSINAVKRAFFHKRWRHQDGFAQARQMKRMRDSDFSTYLENVIGVFPTLFWLKSLISHESLSEQKCEYKFEGWVKNVPAWYFAHPFTCCHINSGLDSYLKMATNKQRKRKLRSLNAPSSSEGEKSPCRAFQPLNKFLVCLESLFMCK